MIFNPPYVVTTDEEMEHAKKEKDVTAAWAGGEDGTVVINEFIPWITRYLSERGVLYLLLIEENGIKEIVEKIKAEGLQVTPILKREVMAERQVIMRVSR